MSKRKILVFILTASLALIAGSALAQEPCSDELRQQLVAVADGAKIEVNTDDIVSSVGEGVTVATTTIVGYENVPGSALPEGVNAGFIYLDAAESGIPTGFYTLRASAEEGELTVGEFPGTVELVSASGAVAATFPAAIEAFSLEVPDPLPYPRTIITHELGRTDSPGEGLQALRRGWRITIEIRCPNGTTIRFTIRW